MMKMHFAAQDEVVETPVFIETSGQALFGILAERTHHPADIAVIHLRGGNQGPSSGRNQTSARLCRRLAQRGYRALRFDYRGVGDSTGTLDRFRHDETFESDVAAWASWLGLRGVSRFVLVGECFGARTALASAEIDGLVAVALLAAPVRDAEKLPGSGTAPLVRHRSLAGYVARAFRPDALRALAHSARHRRKYLYAARAALHAAPAPQDQDSGPGWVSHAFLAQLEEVLGRDVRVLFVRGTVDPGFEDFDRAMEGRLGVLLERFQHVARVATIEGRVAAWADVVVQEEVIELIGDWLAEADLPVTRSGERAL